MNADRAVRLNAAADALTYMAVNYICEPAVWPSFAAWCNQQPGAQPIPDSPKALAAVRSILVQREVASILDYYRPGGRP